jgi:hypothetical protein
VSVGDAERCVDAFWRSCDAELGSPPGPLWSDRVDLVTRRFEIWRFPHGSHNNASRGRVMPAGVMLFVSSAPHLIHPHTDTDTPTKMCRYTHAQTHTHTHAQTHGHTHTRTRTRTCTCTCTCTHTHTRTAGGRIHGRWRRAVSWHRSLVLLCGHEPLPARTSRRARLGAGNRAVDLGGGLCVVHRWGVLPRVAPLCDGHRVRG